MTVAQLLMPAVVLVLWTLVMVGWMAGTRFPSMQKAGMDLAKAPPGGRGQDLENVLPKQTMWVSHNLTHLHEQPTIFYATIGVLALLQDATPLTVGFAWAYTGIRVVHSIYQATVNRVSVRFVFFLLSTMCLAVLAVLALLATLNG